MVKKQKRVMAIHDISCFGRCSLTVALPIISAVGVEVSVIPTAILSTHTGGFEGYTYNDLTSDMLPIVNHWQSLGLEFDAIYTGFLGSFAQIDIVCEIIRRFKRENSIVLIDPVMGDGGKLYTVFSKDFPKGMLKLCQEADIIVPNITEATLLLGEEYRGGPYTKEHITDLVKKLSEKTGDKKVVLTGVHFDKENLGAACYDNKKGEIEFVFSKRIEGFYHGTGDVFASGLLSALLSGKSLKESTQIAVDFTSGSIMRSFIEKTDARYGVNFEEGLEGLIKACKR